MKAALKRALARVARRIRWLRAATALQWSLAVGSAAMTAWLLVSFVAPVETVWLKIAVTSLPLVAVPPMLASIWPISLQNCARRADACGLRERAQTAVELAAENGDMQALQMEDAIDAINRLDVRAGMRLRIRRAPLIATAVLLAGCCALAIVPNPQQDILDAREGYRSEMASQAARAEEMARTLENENANDPQAQEVRRALSELARRLREADGREDALKALDETRVALERLERQDVRAASEALAQAGMDSLAQALAQGDGAGVESALREAAESGEAQRTAEALESAASAVEDGNFDAAGQLSGALTAAAQALSGGETTDGQAQQLAQAAQSGALGSAQTLLRSMKAAAQSVQSATSGVGQGDGSGQGQDNQGGSGQGESSNQGGAGGGKGSTNEDGGISAERPASQNGNSGGRQFKMGEYEQIYDPTRLGDGGQVSQSSGEVREGESQQVDLGPGAGDLSGYVPYNQVIGEYADAASDAAQAENLPESARTWISNYFSALTQ